MIEAIKLCDVISDHFGHKLVFAANETFVVDVLADDRKKFKLFHPIPAHLGVGVAGLLVGFGDLFSTSNRNLLTNYCAQEEASVPHLGLMIGYGGLVVLAHHLREHLSEPNYALENKIRSCDPIYNYFRLKSTDEDFALDLYDGLAGYLFCMSEYWPLKLPVGFFAALDLLLSEINKRKANGKKLLSGMAHGQAGIALALYSAHKRVHDDSLLQCANRLVESEVTRIDRGIITDTRGLPDTPVSKMFCNGPPGLAILNKFCPNIISPIEVRNENVCWNNTFCHGIPMLLDGHAKGTIELNNDLKLNMEEFLKNQISLIVSNPTATLRGRMSWNSGGLSVVSSYLRHIAGQKVPTLYDIISGDFSKF